MQPFVNPNYYTQYSQMPQTNLYSDRMSQMQQYQPVMQNTQMQNQFVTLGKMVESVDVLKATDIPMDGNMYFFPKADGTEVYSKQWLANGQTRILTFKPVLDDDVDNSAKETEKSKFDGINDVLGGIQSDIKSLNDKIDKMSKSTTASRTKKEGNSDE